MVNEEPWQIELTHEVSGWLEGLSVADRAKVIRILDLLSERGVLLGEPHSRQLRGKLRELRLFLGTRQLRVTYYIRTGRLIVLLTVFYKTQRREQREIERAIRAMLSYDREQE